MQRRRLQRARAVNYAEGQDPLLLLYYSRLHRHLGCTPIKAVIAKLTHKTRRLMSPAVAADHAARGLNRVLTTFLVAKATYAEDREAQACV